METIDMDVSELRNMLTYDKEIGVLFWRSASRPHFNGREAGSKTSAGYVAVKIRGRNFQAHRLIMALVEGAFPPAQVDHINGNRSDNRYANLRHATHAENSQNRALNSNSTNGFLGVRLHKPTHRWLAQISYQNKKRHVGLFDTPEEAHAAYRAAKAQLHTFNPVPRQ